LNLHVTKKRALILILSLAIVVALLAVGAVRQRRETRQFLATLARMPPAHADRVSFALLEHLPAPVSKYLRFALREGQERIALARFEQIGQLRTDIGSGRWMPFEATHTVAALTAGFLWNAKVRAFPLVHVRVRDAYMAGRGSGDVSLLSAVPIASQAGGVEVNSGSLHRYLAEAPWYPTALLPGATLKWTPINATTALATLTDAATTVSLEFRFTDAGDVAGIYAPGRWGNFNGAYRQVPWEGHFRDYQRQHDMMIPAEGEVGWHVGGRWQRVWSGHIITASFCSQDDIGTGSCDRRP
jgi:uncharacterized protein DUF6544